MIELKSRAKDRERLDSTPDVGLTADDDLISGGSSRPEKAKRVVVARTDLFPALRIRVDDDEDDDQDDGKGTNNR